MGFALRPLVYDITYLDGETERVQATMRARVEVERTWPEGSEVTDTGKLQLRPPPPAFAATILVAWWSKQTPADVEAMQPAARKKAIDEWSATVAAISEVDDEPVDPSQPAATDD